MADSPPRKKGAGDKRSPKKLRKWELERRRRRIRRAVPLLLLAVGLVAVVVGAAVLLPPPGPSGTGPCDGPKVPLEHYHASLQIYQDGVLRNIPGDIGIDPALTKDTSLIKCTSGDPAHGTSPVHTHAGENNLIHIETIVDRTFTLGDFFRVWGQPIGPTQTWDMVADANHRLTMTVNGQPSDAWGDLVLQDSQQIRIDYTSV